MAKVKLLKAFTHNGRKYSIGDDFEGTDAEIADLANQGYAKDGKEPQLGAVTDVHPRSVDVSASSSGSTGDSYTTRHTAQPEKPTHK